VSRVDVVDAVDRLYEQTMADPQGCGDAMLSDWLKGALGSVEPPPPGQVARELRRAARLAVKLARYWSDPQHSDRVPGDWRIAVDEALGSRGWNPALSIALVCLDEEPCPELFEQVQRRWRQVHFEPFREGVSYEQWLEDLSRGPGTGESDASTF
jgi:hypothetical protein